MVIHSKDRTLDRRFRGVMEKLVWFFGGGSCDGDIPRFGDRQIPSIYFRGRTVRLSLSFTDGNKQDLAGFSLMFME